MKREILDYTLVSLGFGLMVYYHVWLLYRIITQPTKTVIGINAIKRKIWVKTMMEDTSKYGVLAVQTLRSNIMASTLLASTTIMLSSLTAVLMTNKNSNQSSGFVFGDNSPLGFSMKFFSILLCFLLAFLFNVQLIRYYSHANILINVPLKKMKYYFSFPLFLWIFGPIPMFCCCLFQIFILYFFDIIFEFGLAVGNIEEEYDKEKAI
ncbi:hypothetical protein MKX01_035225 [Papaver californicum]|nr:hypothetical protein MKX01_035225 [Papaver californicum]